MHSVVLAFAVLACSRTEAATGASAAVMATTDAAVAQHRTISVLTYNIEGLAWPARSKRGAKLAEIGQRLRALRIERRAPDVVMIQEMFSPAAKRAIRAAGYPELVTGPRRTTRREGSTTASLPGKRRFKSGELGLRFTGSGLAIASTFPIVDSAMRAYGKRSCAGSTAWPTRASCWRVSPFRVCRCRSTSTTPT